VINPTHLEVIVKAGIVRCGLNSDYDINFAKDYPDLDIIEVVDRNEKRATPH
jgi:hypothetical protein